eukprot:8209135-Alexandrium_andersonii.AAC.1
MRQGRQATRQAGLNANRLGSTCLHGRVLHRARRHSNSDGLYGNLLHGNHDRSPADVAHRGGSVRP